MSNLSVIQNVTEVRSDPFPYVCVEGAMPDRFYRELEATFPEDMIINNTQPHDGGITYRFKCKEATMWQPPAIWQDFFAYHSSTEYFRACAELFAPHIVAAYGEEFYENLKTKPVSVRDVDNSGHYVTDCQFVVHEPVDQTGTSRTPHVDNPVEIYAGLLYMRKPNDTSAGGNFTIHEQTGNIEQVNKTLGRQVEDSLHKSVKQVPYVANSFCMFLNVKDSVHSVTPRIRPQHR